MKSSPTDQFGLIPLGLGGLCPNGQPFLDLSGTPIACRPLERCPMLGFNCYSAPGQISGICCPGGNLTSLQDFYEANIDDL